MIGAMITGVTAFLFGIIMAILALMFMKGKCIELIAGYKDMTETEKKDSAEAIAIMTGKTLMAVAVLTLLYSGLSVMTALELLSSAVFIASTIIYVTLFVSIVIISVARFVKKNI